MYVARVPNRGSPPAILLRESYREGGKVKNRTLANLSRWHPDKIEALSAALEGRPVNSSLEGAFEISRSLPHGHVAAVLGTLRALGLEEIIDRAPSRHRDLVVAMTCSQVIDPSSVLACARGLRSETASTSLGEVLGLSGVDEDDLYEAMDWLYERQAKIEDALAAKHLKDGMAVLYDCSTAAFEGVTCPLGAIGNPKDGVRGRVQIVYGLLATKEGIPIAIEVFKNNTAEQTTLASQVKKLKERFSLSHICVVGDRGLLTKARSRDDIVPAELDFITAVRAPEIKSLVESGTIQLSLFDETDIFEISDPDYPGQRLVACKNPALAESRAAKREALLRGTDADLNKIAAATKRENRPLWGKDKIALRVGGVINAHKVAKHFVTEITYDSFSFHRDQDNLRAEAASDGVYVVRTNLEEQTLETSGVVGSYKALSDVERLFRGFNTDLDIRPIRHRSEDRVRTHVFLRMLSYYLSWHMQHRLAPMLFQDDDREAAKAARSSPVAPAQRSRAAINKVHTNKTAEGYPVHSFKTMLADLGTICLNKIKPTDAGLPTFTIITSATPLQRRALELLGVSERLGAA